MGICSWIMHRLYNFETDTKQIPTALIVPPLIPMFSEDQSIIIIQNHARKWHKKRTRAATVIQHRYEARVMYKYFKLKEKITLRSMKNDKKNDCI